MTEIFPTTTDIFPSILSILPWIFLYPETHYRFRFFPFSLYYRRRPEILFDVPERLEPGYPLPVLLMIRDAHRFPVSIHRLLFKAENSQPLEIPLQQEIRDRWWYRIFEYPLSADLRGKTIDFSAELYGSCRGKSIVVRQDNLAGLGHRPFRVHLAKALLPYPKGWIAGDLHVHSDFTDDQVEFGAPLVAIHRLGRAAGLSFAGIHDHSYDLDDCIGNYLQNDPSLLKWKAFQNDIRRFNAETTGFVLLPGEEVTARNDQGRNVHCLILHEPNYIPGSGDSAERWFRTRSEYTLRELPALLSPEALMIAAHPMEPVPFLQRLLIHRGTWHENDCKIPRLHGLQALNGSRNPGFYAAIRQWQQLLLEGKKIFLFGGSDAHGNFNRFRQVRIPMIRLIEKESYQLFGRSKTLLYLGEQPLTPESVREALCAGRAVISDGPFLEITAQDTRGQLARIGETHKTPIQSIYLHARSTAEFGDIERITLYSGQYRHTETCLSEWSPGGTEWVIHLAVGALEKGYFRAELETVTGRFAYTNPLWVELP